MSFKRNRILAVLLTAIILVAFGCMKDSEITAPVPAGSYVFPDTPGKLMANFVEAYGGMDLEGFAGVLHPEFRFLFQPCDVQELGLAGNSLGRKEELEVAANMFSRAPVRKDDGRVLPAITSIEFLNFEPVGRWSAANDLVDFPGAVQCTYQVQLKIRRDCASSIVIQGQTTYVAASREVKAQGGDRRPYFQLVGWIDRTEGCLAKDD